MRVKAKGVRGNTYPQHFGPVAGFEGPKPRGSE